MYWCSHFVLRQFVRCRAGRHECDASETRRAPRQTPLQVSQLQDEIFLLETLMDNVPDYIYFKDRAEPLHAHQPLRGGAVRHLGPGARGRAHGLRLLHRRARDEGAARRAGDHPHRPAAGERRGEGDAAKRRRVLGVDDEAAAARSRREHRRDVRHLARHQRAQEGRGAASAAGVLRSADGAPQPRAVPRSPAAPVSRARGARWAIRCLRCSTSISIASRRSMTAWDTRPATSC